MSEQLERRYQPERRAFYGIQWIRERRNGFDRRAKVAGPERRGFGHRGMFNRRPV